MFILHVIIAHMTILIHVFLLSVWVHKPRTAMDVSHKLNQGTLRHSPPKRVLILSDKETACSTMPSPHTLHSMNTSWPVPKNACCALSDRLCSWSRPFNYRRSEKYMRWMWTMWQWDISLPQISASGVGLLTAGQIAFLVKSPLFLSKPVQW